MSFAQKLLDLRTQYGYSQEVLAEKLGVSRQAISKWELGAALPETDKVINISDFFDVSIDYLLKDGIQTDSGESLDRVVIKFLSSARDMDNISRELVEIVKDGVIDEEERKSIDNILETLDSISATINEIKRKVNL